MSLTHLGEMSDRGPKTEQEYLGEGYGGGTKSKDGDANTRCGDFNLSKEMMRRQCLQPLIMGPS